MIGLKGRQGKGPSVCIFKYNGVDFILTAVNDALVKLTDGKVASYVGMCLSELTPNFPEVRRNMMKCFKSKSVVKSTQMYRFKSTGEEAFFASVYVNLPSNQVAVIAEHVMDTEEGETKRRGKAARLHEAMKLAREKDIALRQVLNHMDMQLDQLKAGIQRHIDVVVMPLMNRLEQKLTGVLKEEMRAIRAAVLGAVPAPADGSRPETANLTPREIQVCELIKSGYQSKEIAVILNIAVRTVSKIRQNIRDKLGICGSKKSLQEALTPLEETE